MLQKNIPWIVKRASSESFLKKPLKIHISSEQNDPTTTGSYPDISLHIKFNEQAHDC